MFLTAQVFEPYGASYTRPGVAGSLGMVLSIGRHVRVIFKHCLIRVTSSDTQFM